MQVLPPTHTLLTRRRWNGLFGISALSIVAAGGTAAIWAELPFLPFLHCALMLVIPWLGIHLLPKDGLPVPNIRSQPGLPQLLWWLAVSGSVLMLAFCLVERVWGMSMTGFVVFGVIATLGISIGAGAIVQAHPRSRAPSGDKVN